MDEKNSIGYIEAKAFEKIYPDIQEHLNYLNCVYDICFEFQHELNDKSMSDIDENIHAQIMIVMRITDFLRSIQLLAKNCYPEQAGTMTASIFELAHTAIHFSYTPEAAKKWLNSNSIKDQMPKIIGVGNWQMLIKINCEFFNKTNYNSEYQVYKQLCWMKHSLPKMQDIRINGKELELLCGPYTDERSINHTWFAMQHAGRLTEFALSSLIEHPIFSIFKEKLQFLLEKQLILEKKARIRFSSINPF